MSGNNSKEKIFISRNKKNVSSNSIKSLGDDVRLRTIFNSFFSNNSNDDYSLSSPHCLSKISSKKNEIFQRIYKRRKLVNSLFSVKNSIFSKATSEKPISLKYFEFGLKKVFFGPDGLITNKFGYLKQAYKRKRKTNIGLDTRIFTGCLDYLDLKNKKSSTNRLDEFARNYMKRSANFAVAEGQNDIIHAKIASKLSEKKNSNFSKINVNTRSSSYIINKMKSKTIRKQMSNLSHDNMYSEFILFKPNSPYNSSKKFKSKKAKINLKLKLNNFVSSKRKCCTPTHSKILSKVTNPSHYNSVDFNNNLKKPINHNSIRNSKKELNSKIKLIENDLLSVENKMNLYIEDSNPKIKKIEEKNSKQNIIKKNVELITNIKIVDEKSKRKAKFLLKNSIQGPKANIYKSSIFRFTEGISKINSDAAFKFGKEINSTYSNEVKEEDFINLKENFYPKKNYFNEKLRKNCFENNEKLKNMLVRLKKKKKITE